MKKLKLVTDGVVHGASILDENGNEIGHITEVVFKERKPLTLIKVGSENFRPTSEDLDNMRQIFENAAADKDFIFTYPDVQIEQIYPRGSVEIRAVIDIDQEE